MLNRCDFIGNLGRDPEIRSTQDGTQVANYSIGVTIKRNGKENTQWVNCVSFGDLAGVIQKYVKKGMKVYVSGTFSTRTWEKDGQKHYTTEILVNQLIMLDKKREDTPHEEAKRNGFEPDEDIPF